MRAPLVCVGVLQLLTILHIDNAMAQVAQLAKGVIQPGSIPATTQKVAIVGTVFTFLDGTVTLTPGAISGHGVLTIHLTTPVAGKKPSIFEFGSAPATVIAGPATSVGNPLAGDWQIPITARGLEVNRSLTRHVQVVFNGSSETENYTISNIPPYTFSWNVIHLAAVSRGRMTNRSLRQSV